MSSLVIHEREQDDADVERYTKRPKTSDATRTIIDSEHASTSTTNAKQSASDDHVLPPSHALLGIPLPVVQENSALNFLESNVGISEYVGHGESKIEGIIKQRFTDFLVFEVDQNSNTLHLFSLEKPQSPKKNREDGPSTSLSIDDVKSGVENVSMASAKVVDGASDVKGPHEDPPSNVPSSSTDITGEKNKLEKGTITDSLLQEPWPESFNSQLSPFLSEDLILQVKEMYLEGPEPPRLTDSGWGSRVPKASDETGEDPSEAKALELSAETENKRSSGRGGRGKRGSRGGGRGQQGRQYLRKVLSEPIDSKDTRTAFHKVIRELFNGKLDTETDSAAPTGDNGSRIVIKWSRRGGGRGGGRGNGRGETREERAPRGTYPPYIHFTLQKTNRDTQDALGHLARALHVNVKDLSVAGTKDKRGVTVQRVSLKRNNKIVEDVWRLANGVDGRRTVQDATTQRGERGIRIADLNYRKAGLELGMLKGNAFVITLRNVKVESTQILEETLSTVKNKGFINYYGMQRFGTASVPTHAIGLALLRSEWQKAVSLILQKRHGEHPDVAAARDAWLVEGDLDKALGLLPRRVVAERCILESFKKQGGETRNAMGALSTIPRNLRLMYVHAYQSYVWNAIVSERIKTFGTDKPVVGDLIFDKENIVTQSMEVDGPVEESIEDDSVPISLVEEPPFNRRNRKPYVPPRIKTLTEKDVDNYTIFDVIMPLPGTDVAYPGGPLGERYKEFLRMDGLDPDNFVRKQKEYTLNGSYRAILHLPKEMSWSILRYTDPDVSLAQSDEDKLLGFDPPAVVEDGKFTALQIHLTLGTAAYATMVLREITKTDTSSHIQTGLTHAAEDQKFRGYDGGSIIGGGEEATSVDI